MAVSADYMHARYYSSVLGRFLSVDPVGGKIGSSQSWNRYSYVLNNPLNLVDLFGMEEVSCLEDSGCSQEQYDAALSAEYQAKLDVYSGLDARLAHMGVTLDGVYSETAAGIAQLGQEPPPPGHVVSVGAAYEISPPLIVVTGGLDLNLGLSDTGGVSGFSLTATVGFGLSTGLGASGSGHAVLWPSLGGVQDLNGLTGNVGAAAAGGPGLSGDLFFTDIGAPAGYQGSLETGARFSPVTAVDGVAGVGLTGTMAGYDRNHGWQFFTTGSP